MELYLLGEFKKELDRALAGDDQELIDRWTELYNNAKADYEKKYGSI